MTQAPEMEKAVEHTDAPMPFPHDRRLAEPDMTETQIREWIEACNHEPARRVLRTYLVLREITDAEVERRAAARSLSLSGQWQPIETASKDGCFDLWIEHYEEPNRGHRRPDCKWRDCIDGKELIDRNAFTIMYPWKATHWRPRPAAPLVIAEQETKP